MSYCMLNSEMLASAFSFFLALNVVTDTVDHGLSEEKELTAAERGLMTYKLKLWFCLSIQEVDKSV